MVPNDAANFLFYFNWPTWIAPDNVLLTTLMGTYSGMGELRHTGGMPLTPWELTSPRLYPGINPWPSFDYTYWNLDPWVSAMG